ncbi:MAG: NAD-dependent succinate-semialdehyde dehydrogenase [Alphaproteobacteria bacterium]|nr:NAD-dependent succinate-semialdehyde dehydrogenase [Alphaproteobacteria bacterium]
MTGLQAKKKTETEGVLRAINPATGVVVREQAVDTGAAVEKRLAAAAEAGREWRETSFATRAKLLNAVADVMQENKPRYAAMMTEEMGKPAHEADGEVEKSIWCSRHYAEHAESYLAREVIESDATLSYVQYMPLGTVLGILPWNAPFWLAFRFAAPALMAGNTCLMKHDPHVPGCAAMIAEAFEKADVPAGIFQPLYLETPAVEAVIRDARVRAVSFTGSSHGGAAVARIAASEIKPAVLELGGSDPCIVLKDADLDAAADVIVLSRIINAGQSCIAAKRVIAEAPVYDKLAALLKEKLSALKVGDPAAADTKVGPLARADLRDNLHRQVKETIKQGATCLLGGDLPDGAGFFYPVTLLGDVKPGMCAFTEETFGPVAVLIRADDENHAMAMANDTPYGLGASIWSADVKKAEDMARNIEAGQVAINGIVKTDPRLPSGGMKRSGYGRELGPHGIRAFTNAQQVWVGPGRG